MAEIQSQTQSPVLGKTSNTPASSAKPQNKRGPSIHQIYALPAPIRTFPLPAFYPNNPVSLLHFAYAWLGQVIRPPTEPLVIHQGIWSETTISVHVKDEKSMRALWEQGFYGKGSLSRSEPNWMKRELVRKGLQQTHVSEIHTIQRREERAQAKWERARLEQEAINQTRLEEASKAEAEKSQDLEATPTPQLPTDLLPPVGPLELLALPNSEAEIITRRPSPPAAKPSPVEDNGSTVERPVTPPQTSIDHTDGDSSGSETVVTRAGSRDPSVKDVAETPPSALSRSSSSDFDETKTLKRRKSVRFSPNVESATFHLGDPPSPGRAANGKTAHSRSADVSPPKLDAEPVKGVIGEEVGISAATETPGSPTTIINKEHLQLMPEEVFFLTFGLGALQVTDPSTGEALSTQKLFNLFRQFSYFPPRIGPEEPDLEPDDGFLVNYAVYHHFRSLGWVPRAGIKFGVDWLLYARGPVFDHAEFGLIVLPSYTDPWWKASGKKSKQKTWAWLHSIVRVLSHVTKSLVLIYVEVPPPPKFNAALEVGIAEVMKLYKVREVMVKRWSSNRNR